MKWLCGVTVLCFVAAAALWLPGRGERDCLRNLTTVDHAINCRATVAHEREEGNIDASGHWVTNEWFAMLRAECLSCPKSQQKYVLESMTVGVHPYCPLHGHLIEKYGVRHHQAWQGGAGKDIGAAGCAFLGVLLGIATGIVSVLRIVRRRRRAAQPAPAPDSATRGEGGRNG